MPISISNTTLTFNDSTTQTTAATGTVTSVATGNGLSGGTITTTGTLIIGCPSVGSVGAYTLARTTTGVAAGGTIAGSSIRYFEFIGGEGNDTGTPSGTWRNMMNGAWTSDYRTVVCRVS
jgi:hypothetical protein